MCTLSKMYIPTRMAACCVGMNCGNTQRQVIRITVHRQSPTDYYRNCLRCIDAVIAPLLYTPAGYILNHRTMVHWIIVLWHFLVFLQVGIAVCYHDRYVSSIARACNNSMTDWRLAPTLTLSLLSSLHLPRLFVSLERPSGLSRVNS